MPKDVNVDRIIANLEDAKTAIEEAQVESEDQQREILLEDAVTGIENATDQLEDGGVEPVERRRKPRVRR